MIGFLAEGGATPPPQQNNFGDTMSDGIAGPLALLIIVLLALATVLLIRNMNSRLRRLPERFPDEPAPPPSRYRSRRSGPAAASPAAVAGSGAASAVAVDQAGAAAGPAVEEPVDSDGGTDSRPAGHGVPTGPAGPAGS
jgi:hypothetical protein